MQSRGVEEKKAADSSPTAALSQPRPGPATRLRSEEEPPVRLVLRKGWPPPPPVPAGVGGGETPGAPPTPAENRAPQGAGDGAQRMDPQGSSLGSPGVGYTLHPVAGSFFCFVLFIIYLLFFIFLTSLLQYNCFTMVC